MNTPTTDDYAIEPERYELFDALSGIEWTRRDFFRVAGGPREVGAWVHIGEDSAVTVYTGKVEIGQNIRTTLTQVAAEELHVPLKTVRVVMADTAVVPFD